MNTHRKILWIGIAILTAQLCIAAPLVNSEPLVDKPQTFSIDVRDVEIADVIRTISKGYNLNIILDPKVTGKLTLHLSDVPVMEGLKSLSESSGLEVVQDGSVYYIRNPVEQQTSIINFSRGKLTIDVQNMDVRDFLQAISTQTAISIVPDSKVTGKITGKLYQVELDDGLVALLEGNGYTVTKRKNIYQVSAQGPENNYRQSMPMGRGDMGKSNFFVDFSDGRISLDVSNGDLEDVIKAIAQRSEVQIITYGDIRSPLNAKINNMPLNEALALLLGGTRFTFVIKDSIILIGDRNSSTPSGQALSISQLIPLKHIKADDAFKIVPRNIKDVSINVVKEQNALLVTGTSEDIVNVLDFLKTVDIPTPQVIINVLVVEYTRDISHDYGIEYGGGAKSDKATNSFSFPGITYNRKGSAVSDLLKSVFGAGGESFASKLQLDENFYINLRLLEQQQKAKVLAKPSITVLNGNKAQINVDQSQYYKVVTGYNENQNIRFQPITFGIQLTIEPWISQSGQITAVINPEISNSNGSNSDGYPNVSKRSVSTTVRLDNHQTLVLGGLLRSDKQVTYSKVPILGDIPIIGYLFKTTKQTNSQTNLAIYITPSIIENNESVDLDKELRTLDTRQDRPVVHTDFLGNKSEKPDSSFLSTSSIADTTARPAPEQTPRQQPAKVTLSPKDDETIPIIVPKTTRASPADTLNNVRTPSARRRLQ